MRIIIDEKKVPL